MSEDFLFCGLDAVFAAIKNSGVIGNTFNEYVQSNKDEIKSVKWMDFYSLLKQSSKIEDPNFD